MFNVSPRKEKALKEKMSLFGVQEKDLKESFMRSQGPGGQHVNKTSTCVYLVHVPSGMSVKCSAGRSRPLNRFFARRILLDKIERAVTGKVIKEREIAEKIRRQKRKRSKRAKEKMLRDKKMVSLKKEKRKAVSLDRDR
ncbi:MAG TPA: peptide chain release factor-like protein [Candidatus Omnitrophota bacterium]|nr:peptide chain release factor-like protein [Candidatus Omnitrophota bacterium]